MSYVGVSLLKTSRGSLISSISATVLSFEEKNGDSGERERGRKTEEVIALQVRGAATRPFGQIVDCGVVLEQEEGVQRAVFSGCLRAVQVCIGFATGMQFFYAFLRVLAQLAYLPELDGLGWTTFGAGWDEAVLLAVVTQGALVRATVLFVAVDYTEGAAHNAVCAAVADVLLHVDVSELVVDERAGGADFDARRVLAVFTDVAHHEPTSDVAFRVELLDEGHVAPRGIRERDSVVVAVAGPVEAVGRKLVPLLAGHLAGLAADADRGVGEEAGLLFGRRRLGTDPRVAQIGHDLHEVVHMACPSGWSDFGVSGACSRVGHGAGLSGSIGALSTRRPARTFTVNALASCMLTFGSALMAVRSFAMAPTVSPAKPQ